MALRYRLLFVEAADEVIISREYAVACVLIAVYQF
jgi:hypothetical protein